MSDRLKAMLVAIGVATLGGATYLVGALGPGFNVGDAVDAGILTISTPAQLRCRVRIHEDCRLLPDGGMRPRYAVAKMKARLVDRGPDETPLLLLDYPRASDGGPCFEPVGTPDEACELLESGACTDGTVCGANSLPQAEPNDCACRATGQICRIGDGGLLPFRATARASVQGFFGAGCKRYFCGPVVNGENGAAWPDECPP